MGCLPRPPSCLTSSNSHCKPRVIYVSKTSRESLQFEAVLLKLECPYESLGDGSVGLQEGPILCTFFSYQLPRMPKLLVHRPLFE